ncbi:PPE domain-containing protein [Actinokineospora pegani]|uniref:PPE domain-containing protein n=1 Tax=Actinokineospora pegani TaxID=2654637 RepID=UPI0018D436B3|nr:PPE domain-containing protein [Actinokineospora pegani]
MSGHEIYVLMTTGPGSGPLYEAHGLARREAEAEAARAELIKSLAEKTAAGWQGEAGDAAHGAVAPLAEATRLGADNLERTEYLFEMQASTFDETVPQLDPIAASPPESGVFDDLTPWNTDTENQVNDYHGAEQKNIDAYRDYDALSQANRAALPTDYSTLRDPGGDISVRPPDQPTGPPPVKTPNDAYVAAPSGDDGGTVQQGWQQPPGRPEQVRGPSLPAEQLPQPHPGNDRTTPQWTTPQGQGQALGVGQGQNGSYGQGAYGQGAYGQGGGGPYGQGSYGQGGGSFGAGAYGVGGAAGGGSGEHGAGGRGGAGGFGARGGAGGFGGGAGAGMGAGAGAGEHGSGSRGGMAGGPGAADDGRAGGRGGQAGGMGGAGRGGGQGGEDEEHERASFLIEDDPEAVFGTDEITAPPVIGG